MTLQYLRTPRVRTQQQAMADLFFRAEIDLNYHNLGPERFLEYVQSTLRRPLEPEEIARFNHIGANIEQFQIHESRNVLIERMFKAAMELAPIVAAKRWTLLISHKKSFVTSDSPFTLWRMRTPENSHYGVGIITAEEVYFPLDPTKLLIMTPAQDSSWSVERATGQRIREINQRVAHGSQRFVIHDPKHRPLDGLQISKHGPVMHFNGIPATPETNVWNELRKSIHDGSSLPVIHQAEAVDQRPDWKDLRRQAARER